MELPEFATNPVFWIKFIPLFGLLVIAPIFFMDFTDSLSWFHRFLFMIGGGIGLAFAINGKTLRGFSRK